LLVRPAACPLAGGGSLDRLRALAGHLAGGRCAGLGCPLLRPLHTRSRPAQPALCRPDLGRSLSIVRLRHDRGGGACLVSAAMRMTLPIGTLAVLLFSPLALAHSPLDSTGDDLVSAMISVGVLLLFWLLFLLGQLRRPTRWWQSVCFHLGSLVCLLAIAGPLDEWAETSASAHMVQHMLFMVII